MVSLLVEGMTDYLLIEPENQYDNLHFVLVTPYIFHKGKYSSLREHAVAPGIVLKHPPGYLQYRDFLCHDEQAVWCFWLQQTESVITVGV